MRDRTLNEPSSGLLDADEYERRAEVGTGKSKVGKTIRMVVIAACLVAAGGAIALNSGKSDDIAVAPKEQQFAAANPKQVEPRQLTPAPAPAPAPAERVAEATAPKSPPRPTARAPAAKPAPAPIAPPAVITPPPATTIPEVAPAPAQIEPDATAPPADAAVQ